MIFGINVDLQITEMTGNIKARDLVIDFIWVDEAEDDLDCLEAGPI